MSTYDSPGLPTYPIRSAQMIYFATVHCFLIRFHKVFPLLSQEIRSRQHCVSFPFCAYALTCKARFDYLEASVELRRWERQRSIVWLIRLMSLKRPEKRRVYMCTINITNPS